MSKDHGCWIDGKFFFTPLHFEVQGIRAEVEHLADYLLVDEVVYISEADEKIDAIVCGYFAKPELSELDREALIWYYVTYNIEDYLMIMDEGEM